jgi:PhnB protein
MEEEDMVAFYPYLAFAGNCREAFTRYREIFGGELMLMDATEMPEGSDVPTDKERWIVHAALQADGQLLMGADDISGSFDGENRGMCTNVTVADPARAKEVFDALAEGGRVQMPLAETFFSPGFGMLVDRFGTPWMVVTDQPEA